MLAAPAIGPSIKPASTTTIGCSENGTGVAGVGIVTRGAAARISAKPKVARYVDVLVSRSELVNDVMYQLSRSTLSATASPPPRQRVASPVRALRSCIAYNSVVRTRAPLAPIGWPRAIAPPFTFTRSHFQPNPAPSASA